MDSNTTEHRLPLIRSNTEKEQSIYSVNSANMEEDEYHNYLSNLMDRIGWNRTTVLVFFGMGMLNGIWGAETTFVSINIEVLSKVYEIETNMYTVMLSLIYFSIGIGSILVGFLTEKLGRMICLKISVIIYLIFSLLCSFSFDFYFVIGLRCICYMSLGVFTGLSINILAEYLPTKNRGLHCMFANGFFNAGALYIVILNYFLLNNDEMNNEGKLHNFKLINALNSIIALITLVLIYFIQDSPIFLFSVNKDERAYRMLYNMCKNAKIPFGDNEIYLLRVEKEKNKNFSIQSNFSELFSKKFRWLTIINLVICLVSYFNMIAANVLLPLGFEKLNGKTDMNFENILLIFGFVQLPASFVGAIMTESNVFARKRTMWVTALLCGVVYILIIILPQYFAIHIGFIYFFNNIGYNVVYIYIAEAFPTRLRDQAQALIQFISFSIGAWSPFFIYLFQDPLQVCLGMLSATYIICFVFTIFLPFETKDRVLDEEENDVTVLTKRKQRRKSILTHSTHITLFNPKNLSPRKKSVNSDS